MKHLTQRVAWHDRQWDGHVCDHPKDNSSCLALDRIREGRDDALEEELAGRSFAELTREQMPPCEAEGGAFMNSEAWTRTIVHPYQSIPKAAETHGHLLPTPVEVPPFSTFAIPFSRMQRRVQDELEERSPVPLPSDVDPPFPTAWVFGADRQAALLDQFFQPIDPETSLVFFYTKEGQPISDSISRLVVGVGRIIKVGGPLDYEREGERPVPPIWERLISHSVRPDGEEGFLFPYHEYLKPTGDLEEDIRRRELLIDIAVTPDPAHQRTFSYFSEHATADVALSTLVKCLESVRKIREHGIAGGPWGAREEWLNEQISKTWMQRGAFPGLGLVLEALGMRLGTALSLELIPSGAVAQDEDPWPTVDKMLRGELPPPTDAYAADMEAIRLTWAKLTDERRSLAELLSRFALAPEQAKRWFENSKRDAATTVSVSDREILVFESFRGLALGSVGEIAVLLDPDELLLKDSPQVLVDIHG
jgi:hypothetical protein